MSRVNPGVSSYIEKLDKWKAEIQVLRDILLSCDLTEDFKWRSPCYCNSQKNIAIIGGFAEYCALSFFKGALLSDPHRKLYSPGENSQSGRMFKFTSVGEIEQDAKIIGDYISEAISIERSGLRVAFKGLSEYPRPVELAASFAADADFEIKFNALSPGRQRGYLLHFAGAKQAHTRARRIEKYKDRIMNGYGMRDCICGKSKRLPSCDGSHKSFK